MRLHRLVFSLGLSTYCLCFTSAQAADSDLRFWLKNMVWYHDYSIEEITSATRMQPGEIETALRKYDISRATRPAPTSGGPLKVLPYPGGRHPRIGFLDGAIDPMRGTKFSVFLPWPKSGYVVVDLPEAVWANGELIFLAHTHIPTFWDKKGIKIKNIDWTRETGGRLTERRVLPDGVAIESRVIPRNDSVDMELKITNGSERALREMRAQVCIMLKGAPDFNAQSDDKKLLVDEVVAAGSRDGGRWIVTAWDRGRPWQNPPVPCIHSDPQFPDCEPGKSVVARGRILFHEGDDIDKRIVRWKAEGLLHWEP